MKTTKKKLKKELKKVSKLVTKISNKKFKRNQESLLTLHDGVKDIKTVVKFILNQKSNVVKETLQEETQN